MDNAIDRIYRYAGEMSYISTLYLNDMAAQRRRASGTNTDRKSGELTKETVKWLIREFNEADRRGEVPPKYNALVSRLMASIGVGCGVTISMIDCAQEWDDKAVLAYYNGVRYELEAREILKQGIISSVLPPDVRAFDVLGIDRKRYDRWKRGGCYCPRPIVRAIHDAQPTDEGYITRLSALLSELEPGKWIVMGGGNS